MRVQVINSHLRCPRDGKRLVVDVGQEDVIGYGDLRATHSCLHCGYSEIDKNWSRQHQTDRPRTSQRELLWKLRTEGVVVPLVYDDTPFPEAELDG